MTGAIQACYFSHVSFHGASPKNFLFPLKHLILNILVIFGTSSASCFSSAANEWQVSLTNYLRLVIAQNDRLAAQELQVVAAQAQQKGERGIFEPALVGSAEHQVNNRQLNSQALSSTIGLRTNAVWERNNNYSSAIEFLVPTGARLRLGSTLHDLNNTYQQIGISKLTNGEYESFVGVTVAQPILKNAGTTATLAASRLAARQSDVAWQEYRGNLIQVIAGAEVAYLGLHLAQEQVRFFSESVSVAQTVLDDAKARVAAGKSGELDVLQAEADLAARRNGLREAEQKLTEARARAMSGFASTEADERGILMAEAPGLPEDRGLEFSSHWPVLFNHSPELRAQYQKLAQEGIRVAYAKNQRLPQVDVKASYGLNGLGVTPQDSYDRAMTKDYDTWSIGVELRIPLGGGIKERQELIAARARKRAVLLGLKDLETQLGNSLRVALKKFEFTRTAIADHEAAIRLNQNLLDAEMARLKVGRVEARKVLEVERDLLQARLTTLAASVGHFQASIELEALEGSYLARRGLEKSRNQVIDHARLRDVSGMVKDDPASSGFSPK